MEDSQARFKLPVSSSLRARLMAQSEFEMPASTASGTSDDEEHTSKLASCRKRIIEMTQSASGVFDQFRINYGEGLTPTEQLLKRLGERSSGVNPVYRTRTKVNR